MDKIKQLSNIFDEWTIKYDSDEYKLTVMLDLEHDTFEWADKHTDLSILIDNMISRVQSYKKDKEAAKNLMRQKYSKQKAELEAINDGHPLVYKLIGQECLESDPAQYISYGSLSVKDKTVTGEVNSWNEEELLACLYDIMYNLLKEQFQKN